LTRNLHSSVDWATGWNTGVPFPAGATVVFFSIASRPVLGPTTPPIPWVPLALSSEVELQGHETDHSLSSSAGVKNGGAIPTLPLCLYGIVLHYIIKYKYNFCLIKGVI
jgi:hypothetical protein